LFAPRPGHVRRLIDARPYSGRPGARGLATRTRVRQLQRHGILWVWRVAGRAASRSGRGVRGRRAGTWAIGRCTNVAVAGLPVVAIIEERVTTVTFVGD
jgi:hypothetical protein